MRLVKVQFFGKILCYELNMCLLTSKHYTTCTVENYFLTVRMVEASNSISLRQWCSQE